MTTPPSSYGYGERPALQGTRRSFTTPHRRLSYHERAALSTLDAESNIWYTHPSAKIIHFTPPSEETPKVKSPTLPDADYPIDTVETLPWAATGETTLAVGELKIEKVQGSTNFIKCGHVNQAILKNSQCWCVDGVSRFVLRVRKLYYYRIELPTTTPEQTAKVEELKEVLKKILRYEATPCPFKRGFHVELPASAITPRRKGTWKRKEGSFPATPLTEGSQLPRLRSAREWNRRAVSDSKAVQGKDKNRTDSGYAESPLVHKVNGSGADDLGERSQTPSSIDSNEPLSQSQETQHEDDPEEDLDDDPTSQEALPSSTGQTEEWKPAQTEDTIRVEVPAPRESPEQDKETNHITSSGPETPEVIPGIADDIHEEEVENQPHDFPEGNQQLEATQATHEIDPQPASTEIPEETFVEDVPFHTDDAEQLVGSRERDSPTMKHSQNDEGSEEVPRVQEPPTQTTNKPDVIETPAIVKEDVITEGADEEHDLLPDPMPQADEVAEDHLSKTSTIDSFHTSATEDQDAATSYRDEQGAFSLLDGFLERPKAHTREMSELTVTQTPLAEESERYEEPTEALDDPSTPPLAPGSSSDASWGDVPTPLSTTVQDNLRNRLQKHRSHSPMPPRSTMTTRSRTSQQASLPSAILSLAVSKPIEVIVLLVHVIARIAGGATINDLLSGELFRRPEQPRRRTSNLPDQIDARRDDTDDEDDFGVPIRTKRRASGVARTDDDADSLFDLD